MASIENSLPGAQTSQTRPLNMAPASAVPMPRYRTLVADPAEHKGQVLALCARNELSISERNYHWKYRQNPAGPCGCWFLESSGETVGCSALFPRRLSANGKLQTAAVAGDLAVNREHRVFWPALLLQRAVTSAVRTGQFELAYGIPNTCARQVQASAGFIPAGNLTFGVKPLRSRYFLERYLHLRHGASWVAKLLDPLLHVCSRESSTRPGQTPYEFEDVRRFDQRFDVLWQKSAHAYRIIGERNAAFLNWRFFDCPTRQYSALAATSPETGEALAYVVFYISAGRVHIADVLACDDHAMRALLATLLQRARAQQMHSVAILFFGATSLLEALRDYSFIFRTTSLQLFIYSAAKDAYADLLNQKNWYFLDADTDR